MRLEIFQGTDRQWYWRLKAKNHQTVAVGGEGYTRKHGAKRAYLRMFAGILADTPVLHEVR